MPPRCRPLLPLLLLLCVAKVVCVRVTVSFTVTLGGLREADLFVDDNASVFLQALVRRVTALTRGAAVSVMDVANVAPGGGSFNLLRVRIAATFPATPTQLLPGGFIDSISTAPLEVSPGGLLGAAFAPYGPVGFVDVSIGDASLPFDALPDGAAAAAPMQPLKLRLARPPPPPALDWSRLQAVPVKPGPTYVRFAPSRPPPSPPPDAPGAPPEPDAPPEPCAPSPPIASPAALPVRDAPAPVPLQSTRALPAAAAGTGAGIPGATAGGVGGVGLGGVSTGVGGVGLGTGALGLGGVSPAGAAATGAALGASAATSSPSPTVVIVPTPVPTPVPVPVPVLGERPRPQGPQLGGYTPNPAAAQNAWLQQYTQQQQQQQQQAAQMEQQMQMQQQPVSMMQLGGSGAGYDATVCSLTAIQSNFQGILLSLAPCLQSASDACCASVTKLAGPTSSSYPNCLCAPDVFKAITQLDVSQVIPGASVNILERLQSCRARGQGPPYVGNGCGIGARG